ncbi:hypothetical protein CF327_g7403 [Tilletia walkeri]|nr:hypothetical protein CF327_g7403 [Tilletia walkeri]
MNRARADIRSYVGEFGIFHLFLTLNPKGKYDPNLQVFYGDQTIDINSVAPQLPHPSVRAVRLADDPVAGCDYFHFHVAAVFQYLFGWDVRAQTITPSGGILVRLSAYFMVKEHTMRGKLHGHVLLLLDGGLNPRALRQKMQADPEFNLCYLDFFDDLIHHHLPDAQTNPTEAPSTTTGKTRVPREERAPDPANPNYREVFEQDHRLLGELLQRHVCRAVRFKGGRIPCRFLFPHEVGEEPSCDASTNSINLRIKDPNVNWHYPTLLVATRHNHDLKSVHSGKRRAAAAAFITSYATKSDETPTNQVAMINTVFQRLEQQDDVDIATKSLLTRCIMQFG